MMNTKNGQTAWIEGHPYEICDEDMGDSSITVLKPLRGTGSWASANIASDAYEYTHGGNIFREAVRRAWKIEEMKNKQNTPKKICECCGQKI